MALKYGSSSKSSAFKRSAFPMQSGTVSHASALKQAKELSQVKQLQEYKAEQELIALQNEAAKKAKKKAKKEITKKELEEKGVKDESGNYILGEMERGDTKYDPKKDYSKPDPDLNLSKKAAKRAKKKNLKTDATKKSKVEYQEHKEEADKAKVEAKVKANRSEKTKSLSEKVLKKDKQTEDAFVEKELAESRVGKYDKGLFGGSLRRAMAKGKHKRKGRQEDKTREKLAESERWDQLTPEQKATEKAKKKEANVEEIRRAVAGLSAYGPGGSGSQTKEKQEYDAAKLAQADTEKAQASQDIRDARTQQYVNAHKKAESGEEMVLKEDTKYAVGEGGVNMTAGEGGGTQAELRKNKKS